jgi:hypothetical protein
MPSDILAEVQKSMMIYKEIHDTSSFATFGDTVIFHGGFSTDQGNPPRINNLSAIAQMAFSVIEVMKANIKFDLRLRGSFALGNYLAGTKSDTIMGEALIEAYESYERANWIGIVAAPGKTEGLMDDAHRLGDNAFTRTMKEFDILELTTRKDWWNLGISFSEIVAMSICDTIAKYPVWYKEENQENYTQKEMWVPAWPILLHLENMMPEDIQNIGMGDKPQADAIFSTITQARASAERRHHPKYDNAAAYYEYIWTKRREFLDFRDSGQQT